MALFDLFRKKRGNAEKGSAPAPGNEGYGGLKYVPESVNPQGRSRVYFCCHEDDFKRYFEAVTNEIRSFQPNATVFYYDPAEGIPEGEDFLSDLSRMQLFVIPVTSNFIHKESRARTLEFSYAIDHHIPVLPLMQESGLNAAFNDICGDLQYLDRNAAVNDLTAIPYEEKLRKYLDSVLVDDKLAEKIRAAFDAYIFLSYRKKDRKYAQEIMRLIHENEMCRDIAIWYDEFLVPGENFTDAISEAMEKCSLFAFAVTPSLLEDPNYVMTVEYPEARRTGKPILPIEAVPTDRTKLAGLYSGIDNIHETADKEGLNSYLSSILKDIALGYNNDDPMHEFFIGLAYLSGIDVETDHDRALKLITDAAEKGLPEAYEKLVSMYNLGEGVKRDYVTAAEWQDRYASMLERTTEDPLATRSIISALWDLGDLWKELGKTGISRNAYERMMTYAEKRENVLHNAETRRDLSVSYNKLGDMCRGEGDLKGAGEYYHKCLVIREQLARETDTAESRNDLSVSFEKLGYICRVGGDLKGAGEYYLKGLDIRERLAMETGNAESREALAVSYNNMGDIYMAQGDLKGAAEYYFKGFDMAKQLAGETGTVGSFSVLSVILSRLGDVYRKAGDLNGAREYYLKGLAVAEQLYLKTGTVESCKGLSICFDRLGEVCRAERDLKGAGEYYLKGLEIREQLVRETETAEFRKDLSLSYERLGDICKADGDLKCAREYFIKCLDIREKLAAETGTSGSSRELSVSLFKMGDICRAEGDLKGAKEYCLKDLEIRERLALEKGTLESRRDLSSGFEYFGDICCEDGDLKGAEEYFIKCLDIREQLALETGTLGSRRELSKCLDKLGDICRAEGDSDGAKEYYLKALDTAEQLAEVTGTQESFDDLAVSHYKIGLLTDDRSYYRKAYEIFKDLTVKYPENDRYRKNRDAIFKLLDRDPDEK